MNHTPICAAEASAREARRQGDGKFGSKEHSEADVALQDSSTQARRAEAVAVTDALAPQIAEHYEVTTGPEGSVRIVSDFGEGSPSFRFEQAEEGQMKMVCDYGQIDSQAVAFPVEGRGFWHKDNAEVVYDPQDERLAEEVPYDESPEQWIEATHVAYLADRLGREPSDEVAASALAEALGKPVATEPVRRTLERPEQAQIDALEAQVRSEGGDPGLRWARASAVRQSHFDGYGIRTEHELEVHQFSMTDPEFGEFIHQWQLASKVDGVQTNSWPGFGQVQIVSHLSLEHDNLDTAQEWAGSGVLKTIPEHSEVLRAVKDESGTVVEASGSPRMPVLDQIRREDSRPTMEA